VNVVILKLAFHIKWVACRNTIFFLLPFSLIFFSSCQHHSIKTYEAFDEIQTNESEKKAGTSQTWQKIHTETQADGQPRAILLDHGEDSLTLRINLIRSAQESISIQTFSWDFDEVGKFILWELIQANQKRGVRVRLLIDHMFNKHQPEMIAFLSTLNSNFEIRYFNPTAKILSPSFLEKISDLAIDFHDHNARLHNKLMVVDDKYAITGGRNINNHYFDQVIGLNYKDRDVLLILPNSEELSKCLYSYWNSKQSIPTYELKDVNEILINKTYSKSLDQNRFFEYSIFQKISADANDIINIRRKFIEPMIKVDRVEWICDSPDKVEHAPSSYSTVNQKLLSLMKSANDEILIQSPYMVLSDETQNVFRNLKNDSEDLDIRISTNSLAATDNWMTYAANYKEKRIYLEDLNLEIWEFKPIPEDISEMMNYEQLLNRAPFKRELTFHGVNKFKINKSLPSLSGEKKGFISKRKERMNPFLKTAPFLSLHAKSFVIDQQTSFVGSYNLDPRSEIYNTELGVIIHDVVFASALKESIERDVSPQNSYLIEIKKRKPLLSTINMLLYRLSEALPLIDPWPIRSHASFELKGNKKPVPPGHPSFFEHWKDVGNFPGLPLFAKKQISARIFKAAGMIFKPLL
jgi:phosphatidylserine/phosphatidylglycerophosphate/cardiolipin synthase-like enzyme